MILFHHNDPDGRCAAAIVDRFVRDEDNKYSGIRDFVELNYHTHEFREVLPDERVYIVDYSLPVEIMNEILKVTENVVLIDHHISTKYRIEEYEGCFSHYCDFDGCKAGCLLAWEFFRGDARRVPAGLRLISDYDTWTHTYSPDSTYFTIGLNLFDCNPLSTIWDDILELGENPDYSVGDIIKVGKNCVEFRDSLAKTACDEFGFEAEFEGCKCFVLYCSALRSSLCFGERIDQYDMCVMVVPHGKGCTIRLYSNNVLDVSEVAKKYGGGGHKGAGGFVAKRIPREFLVGEDDG